jgi:regulation of enolase protein 1 (concanavalin A-like superfamily)
MPFNLQEPAMSWPLSQDYNEAIQDPRNSFSDPELQTGEAAANALGIPMPRSGNFADVYEIRCPSSKWAVKCFTRQVPGLRERYSEISKHLAQVQLPFMVDFQYLEQGIRVRGQWYPILKMQWVEGFVLNEFVREQLDNKPILQALGQIWLRMARRLRDARIAHCDLQHGNVLLVPGRTAQSLAVKLIDYDGMCVPALVGSKSGELGHPAFQHPERLETGAYNPEIDRFSLLGIATALRCLTVGGRSLWDRYDTGDNLLFRQSDLKDPKGSPLFAELLQLRDEEVQPLIQAFYRACQRSLSKVPLLTDLVPEEKSAKVTTAPAKSKASSTATQTMVAAAPDFDFADSANAGEAGPPSVRSVRKAGLPGWVWAVGGVVAAMVLLGIGVAAGLLLRAGTPDKSGAVAAQNSSENKNPRAEVDLPAKQPEVPAAPKPQVEPAAEPKPPNNPQRLMQVTNVAWDPVIDPDGDCQLRRSAGKLIVTVPDKPHVLPVNGEAKNSPRVLFEVEGDFAFQTRVSGDFQTVAASSTGRVSWMGAGLLLWVDDGNFARLERAALYGRMPPTYLNWEVRQDGKPQNLGFNFPALSGADTHLRLERRSNQVLASYSEDGVKWSEVKPLEIELPPKVKIGLIAGSTAARVFVPSFDQLQLQKGPGEMMRVNLPTTSPNVVVNPLPLDPAAPLPVGMFVYAPNGEGLAVSTPGESSWRLLNPRTNEPIRTFKGHQKALTNLAFSGDGKRAVTTALDRTLRVWDVQTGELIRMMGMSSRPLAAIALSNDSRRVGMIMKPDMNSCHLFDFEAKSFTGYAMHRRPLCMTFAPDSQSFIGGLDEGEKDADKLVMLWPLVPGNRVRFFNGRPAPVTAVAFSPDGKYVAAGLSGPTPAAALWDASNGTGLWQNNLPASPVHQMVFSPDSRFVLAGAGAAIRLFRVPGGQPAGEFNRAGADLAYACFTADSKEALCVGRKGDLPDKAADVLRLPTTEPTTVVNPTTPPSRRRVANKPAVPDDKALADARQKIRETYKDLYDMNNARRELAQKLLEEGRLSAIEAERYVCLDESRTLAARAGDIATALRAASELSNRFAVDLLEVKSTAIEQILPAVNRLDENRTLAQKALILAERALMEEEYETADRLVKVARAAADRADVKETLKKAADQLARQLDQQRTDYEQVKASLRLLEEKPEDPEANLAVGQFRCVAKGDWKEGLPLLAKGSNKELAEVAEKDLADPEAASAQVAVGDGWWDQADKAAGKVKTAWQQRAYRWYDEAYPRLGKSEAAARVQARLKTLIQKVPQLGRSWSSLDISGATALRLGSTPVLRLLPHHMIATREWYSGPIEIDVVALLTNKPLQNHIKITFLNGGEVNLTVDDRNLARIKYAIPRGGDPDGSGQPPGNGGSTIITPNQPVHIRFDMTEDNAELWINERSRLRATIGPQSSAGRAPVRIWSEDSHLDILAVSVKAKRNKPAAPDNPAQAAPK